MLKSVKMTCFKQHVERTINFTPGVNGIRAPNGSGKSNALLAARYALYGSRALPEPLEDVVSYGSPVSKLKVELDFNFAGIAYQITRSKSLSRLTFPGGEVTGANEVTKFIEQLFGASQDLGSKLMFARQKDVGGALSAGATATSALIESLADLDLITELVSTISEKLPAGDTTFTESTVSTLREQAAEPEQEDLTDLAAAVTAADVAVAAATAAQKALGAQLEALDIVQAREILTEEKALKEKIADNQMMLGGLQVALQGEPLVEPKPALLAAAQAGLAEQRELGAIKKLHDELVAAKVEVLWDKPLESLLTEVAEVEATVVRTQAEIEEVKSHVQALAAAIQKADGTHRERAAQIEGRIVRETTCAFCEKDLTDVPEVLLRNNKAYAELQELNETYELAVAGRQTQKDALSNQLPGLNSSLNLAKAYLKDLDAVIKRKQVLDLLYARAAQHISLNEAFVPAQWTWTGPNLAAPQPDYAAQIAELQKQARKAMADAAKRESAAASMKDLEKRLKAAKARLASLEVGEAQDTLREEGTLLADLVVANAKLVEAKEASGQAHSALQFAQNVNMMAAKNAEKSRELLVKAEAELAEKRANNLLIKKLRAARPVITDKLWAMVLGATSVYYTQMRGTPTVFTRADGKFMFNGHATSGLSGAEEDILGLAIRMALTRMFLPNVDFLVLDEVAAAYDEERELAMFGLFATSGFRQTIIVTHRPLCDSFSDNIIVL